MPYGYSYLDVLWNRKKKLETLRKMSKKEAQIGAFFHSLMLVSLGATLFVIVAYLVFYGFLKSDIYILVLIALFSPVVTQSIFRKYIYLKYGYYKNIFGKVIGVVFSLIALGFFIEVMVKVSKILSISLYQTFKYFIIEYFALIIIALFSQDWGSNK